MKTFQLFAFLLAGSTLASPLIAGSSDLGQAGPIQNGVGSHDGEPGAPSADMDESKTPSPRSKRSPPVGGDSSDKKALAQEIVDKLETINQELGQLKEIQESDSPSVVPSARTKRSAPTESDADSKALGEDGSNRLDLLFSPSSGPPASPRGQGPEDQGLPSKQNESASPSPRQGPPTTPEAIAEPGSPSLSDKDFSNGSEVPGADSLPNGSGAAGADDLSDLSA